MRKITQNKGLRMRFKSTRRVFQNYVGMVLLIGLSLACQLPRFASTPMATEVPSDAPGVVPLAPVPSNFWLSGLLSSPWFLVLVGAMLFLLVGGALFLLVARLRRDGADPARPRETTMVLDSPFQTSRLPVLTAEFTALAEGTALHEGRYVILEVLQATEWFRLYSARGAQPVRICPACNARVDDEAEDFCPHCGTEMQGVAPVYLQYLIKASPNRDTFAATTRILALDLEHPNVIFPLEVFSETLSGKLCYYQVELDYRLVLASRLSLPRSVEQVFRWGNALAQGVSYLHAHNILARQMDMQHIVAEESLCRCIAAENAVVVPSESRDAVHTDFVGDVQALAMTLFYLLTGELVYTPEADLPPQVAAFFAQMFAAAGDLTAEAFVAALQKIILTFHKPQKVTLAVGGLSDVGRKRILNEDTFFVLEEPPIFGGLDVNSGVFAVADGMGGHDAGEVASQLTVDTLQRVSLGDPAEFASGELPDARYWLSQLVNAANHAVYSERERESSDMGCTLVLSLCFGDTFAIANVGDSRAYHLAEKQIRQITTDHSLVERLISMGQITPEEARHHPQKSLIYRVIGDRSQLEIDFFEQVLAPGEALLLCSDGLSGMVPDNLIWRIWQTATSPLEACEKLIEEANFAGGDDNITVVIVQVCEA